MWNDLLNDHTPYIPTMAQLRQEKILYQRIENVYRECLEERKLYNQYRDQILSYLLTQPEHKVIRKKLFRHFDQNDEGKNKQFAKLFRQLVKNKVLSYRQNKDGKYYVRKSPTRKQKSKETLSLPASNYVSWQYEHVDKKTLYKVEYTVDPPQNVDRNTNTCTFISRSSGEKYYTSLNECTCPVYNASEKHACKHMLALAIYLGYISKSDSRFK